MLEQIVARLDASGLVCTRVGLCNLLGVPVDGATLLGAALFLGCCLMLAACQSRSSYRPPSRPPSLGFTLMLLAVAVFVAVRLQDPHQHAVRAAHAEVDRREQYQVHLDAVEGRFHDLCGACRTHSAPGKRYGTVMQCVPPGVKQTRYGAQQQFLPLPELMLERLNTSAGQHERHQLQRALHELQQGPCRAPRLHAPLAFDGITTMLHRMAGALVWGLAHGRAYLPLDPSAVLSADHVPDPFGRHAAGSRADGRCLGGLSYECFFAPRFSSMPSCPLDARASLLAADRSKYFLRMQDAFHPMHDEPAAVCYAPPAFRQHGGFWVHAQALLYLFELRADHAAHFERRRRALLGWRSNRWHAPTIGVHVRRGDKCGHDTVVAATGRLSGKLDRELCADTSFSYVREATREIGQRYGARHVFLATDDPRAAAACQSWEGLTCASASDARRGSNSVDNGPANNQSAAVTLSVLFDVDTLGWCDYFVGTFDSQVRRYRCAVARRERSGGAPRGSAGS